LVCGVHHPAAIGRDEQEVDLSQGDLCATGHRDGVSRISGRSDINDLLTVETDFPFAEFFARTQYRTSARRRLGKLRFY
jgi:hypothetical protein